MIMISHSSYQKLLAEFKQAPNFAKWLSKKKAKYHIEITDTPIYGKPGQAFAS